MSNQNPVIIDGATGEVETLPPQKGKRYRYQLDTVQDVKREMAKVYRECRSEIIDAQTGTKLTWMLGELRKTIELSDFEQRLEAVENVSIKK